MRGRTGRSATDASIGVFGADAGVVVVRGQARGGIEGARRAARGRASGCRQGRARPPVAVARAREPRSLPQWRVTRGRARLPTSDSASPVGGPFDAATPRFQLSTSLT